MGKIPQGLCKQYLENTSKEQIMKNVCIVTLPLHFNFGGILQAFALQEAISSLGYTPYIAISASVSMKQRLKNFLYGFSGVYKFIKTNINYVILNEPYSVKVLTDKNISVLVVGSDQV